jgi:fructose 1,6-bisphosphatase
MFIGSPGKYTVKHVFSRADETIAAASSLDRATCLTIRPTMKRGGMPIG